MPISVSCVICQQPYTLEDHWAGKQVRCRMCKHIIVVPGQAAAAPAVPEVRPAATDPQGIAAAQHLGKIPPPLPRVRPAPPPRRLPAKPKSSGMLPLFLAGGAAVALLAVAVCGVGGFIVWRSLTPTEIAKRDTKAQDNKQAREDAEKKAVLEEEQKRINEQKRIEEQKKKLEDAIPKKGDKQPEEQLKKDLPKKEKTYPVDFQAGQFRSMARLDGLSDALDPVMQKLRKVYTINMQIGHKYTIHHSSRDFDAFLRLEDPTGQEVARDDDSGGGLDALIVYMPSRAGMHSIIATCLDGQPGAFVLTIRDDFGAQVGKEKDPPPKAKDDKVPDPVASGQKLAKAQNKQNGLAATPLDLPAKKIVGDIVWTPQGDAFFTLTEDGVLSRVVLNGFVEEKRLDMSRRCGFLALSGEGLLATMTELQEVWVIDPGTLRVRKRIPAPSVQRGLAGPNMKIALAAGKDGVAVLDLVTGDIVGDFRTISAHHGRVSPDGKYYFAQDGIEELIQYGIEGGNLVEQQKTARIAQNGQCICVSPDSKYVCLPSGGGNYGANYGTYVYSVDNLTKAAFTISSGAYPRLVAFDSAAQLVYTQNRDKQLMVYDMNGTKLKEHTFPGAGASKQFVPHPMGKKLLLLTDKSLTFIELEGVAGGARDVDRGTGVAGNRKAPLLPPFARLDLVCGHLL